MQSFENIGKELERRGKTQGLKELAQSPEGQRISRLVDGEALEKAARSGDTAAIKEIIHRVLSTGDGQKLAENVKKLMEE